MIGFISCSAGMLQCMPVMMFVMIAGPLTDNYGRKPLILSALVGYLVLDLVFLVNSLWFYQLKVRTVRFTLKQLKNSPYNFKL